MKLTELEGSDVQFVFDLFNDPDCIRFIGDRGIKTLVNADNYLQNRLINSYRTHGYGLYKVTLKAEDTPLGICGLVKRDKKNPPDIGFAFLPEYRSQGYCTEASKAVLQWAKEINISHTILAYTNPDNITSIRVLEKLGLQKQQITTLPGQDFESLVMSIKLS
ncbi:MAG: GNAT family N-acetyltransferase [Marinicella sp.]